MRATRHFYGWDLGGAHLKLAGVAEDGTVIRVEQHATPLWQGTAVLDAVLRRLRASVPAATAVHGLTMTGELVDAFPDRALGVASLLDVFGANFTGHETRVYGVGLGFRPSSAAKANAGAVASANWHASAAYIASRLGTGIMLDIGSTTTDIVPFLDGVPCHAGANDLERLQSGELVYTGVVRTPLMALARRAPLEGRWQGVAAELFATAADVYRIRGELDEGCDLYPPADGGGKQREDSIRRLARMFGTDASAHPAAGTWEDAAAFFARRQLELVSDSLAAVRGRLPAPWPKLVGLGAGRFLARRVAVLNDCAYVDFEELVTLGAGARPLGAVCASAIAIAQLARLESVQ